ncbi:NLRC3 [Symbiodinium necroappetens]|uniref:NLRC3 protein n=1 Tax=Symbiodinium necroappetens TaxID=1628268 RepID=A0A812U6D2_9DINO|nr:NLRC3 [Symbiodinium necroappetens]
MCKSLRLADLGAEALGIALSALERYPVLESLEIVQCELRPKLKLLLEALEKIKLRQLHLQQNELFEEGTRQVIEALALQSNDTLAALSLGHDGIGVANVKALAQALRTNSALIELNLSHACPSIDGIIALAEAIKENRTLKQLSLSGATVAEEGAFALLEALQTSGVERRLDLTGCDWGDLGKAAAALARALQTGQVKGTVTHPALEFLCMLQDERLKELEEAQKFQLSRSGFQKLFEPLCRALPELKLRELFLGLNWHGSDDEARALAAGLRQQKGLERLELRLFENSLGEEGGKVLASALARLTELKELELELSQNNIGDAGAAAVAESLCHLRQLTGLKVWLCKNALGRGLEAIQALDPCSQCSPIPTPKFEETGAAGATAVVVSLRELPQLAELKELTFDVSWNQIGVAGAAAVAESLRNLRQLTGLTVWLTDNALGAAGATAVVESLRELPQLTEVEVHLQGNKLGEEEKEKLRATFDALAVQKKRIEL